ncbi:MAG: hypothetical protein WDW36_001451 [Sanguina aurantia]
MTSFSFESESSWSRLPPNLQHLVCQGFFSAPAAVCASNTPALSSLLTLRTDGTQLPLESISQLLRAAPALRCFSTVGEARPIRVSNFTIECPLASSSVGLDLSLLHERMLAGLSIKAILRVEGGGGVAARADIISALPSMSLFKRGSFVSLGRADLQLLLKKFPNVEEVILSSIQGMDDIGMQDLTVCTKITELLFEFCGIGAMGMTRLCRRLPVLKKVSCGGCAKLRAPALMECAQLLQRQYGLRVALMELT